MSAKHDQLMLSQLPLSLTWGYIILSETIYYMCTKYPEPGADGRCRLLYLSARRGILILGHPNSQSLLWCLRSQMFFPSTRYTVHYCMPEENIKYEWPPEIKSIEGFYCCPYWFSSAPKGFLEKAEGRPCQLIS